MATATKAERTARWAAVFTDLHRAVTHAIDSRVAEHQDVQRQLLARVDKLQQQLSAQAKEIAALQRKSR